jgi:hypothetical protein
MTAQSWDRFCDAAQASRHSARSTTILSPRGTHRAVLTEEDGHVRVVITRTAQVRQEHAKLVHDELLDAPFHLVADRIVDLVGELEDA